MVTRRTVIKHGGYAALAMAGGRLFVRDALAQTTTTFDYYISPTGDDNNAGTLASPWSITALNNNAATYAGKRVGLLPGTYQYGTKGGVQTTLYSLCQGGSGSQASAALNVNGGTSGSPTYIASSDSSGHYSPRTATLNATNPSGGAYPTQFCAVIGQTYNQTPAVTLGNLVIDGLIVTGGYGAGVGFTPGYGAPIGGATGLVLKNSEIHHIHGFGPGNFGAVFMYNTTGALVQNCKIHDSVGDGGYTAEDCCGISTQECLNNIYEYNTIYNCNVGIYDKNTSQGSTIRYNYIDNTVNPNACIFDTASGQSGSTVYEYNNILVGGAAGIWGASAMLFPAQQNWVVYNNSIYQPSGGWGGNAGAFLPTTGSVKFYNNIVAAHSGSSGAHPCPYTVCTGSIALSDYNCYQDGSGTPLGQSPTSSPYNPTGYSLASWQSTFGKDLGSTTEPSGTLFSAYSSLSPSSFKTIPSALLTAGRVGGVSSGAATAMGAWGGTDVSLYNGQPIQQIGCNFGPIPNAAVLTVS